MVDIAKATKTLEDYFAGVTKEQFSDDLRKFCPELFEEQDGESNGSKNGSSGETERLQPAEQQLDLLTNNEIYQKAKQDSKIEIAAKLLHKGISVNEVADLLELDVNSLAQPL